MTTSFRWRLTAICLAAGIFRFRGLFANSFHADEALYASWARLIAVWRDPLLWGQALDKPPLLFYAQAFFYSLAGAPVEWAARLPNLIASLLLIPIMARLAWHLYREETTTLITATITAFSPFLIQFSPTAFTDPLLVCLIFAALLAQTRPKSARLAGICLGCAIAVKQPAWLFAPLFAAMGLLMGWSKQQWRNAGIGFLLIAIPLAIWDVARWHNNSWAALSRNYGGIRLAYSWELGLRWREWGKLWTLTHGVPLFGWLIVAVSPFYLWRTWRNWGRKSTADQLFLIFLTAYFLFHWLLVIPVWDRYLLPAIPLAAILLGRSTTLLIDHPFFQRRAFYHHAAWLLLAMAMSPAALRAKDGVYPIGGRPGADMGAAQVAAFLDEQAYPYGTVLYDQAYGWHWRYYLFDKTIYHAWFPNVDDLLDNLAAFGDVGTRLLILPPDHRAQLIESSLIEADYQLHWLFTATHPNGDAGMSLYQIE